MGGHLSVVQLMASTSDAARYVEIVYELGHTNMICEILGNM